MNRPAIRVLIADDQALIREGFAVLLDAQSDITVVGQAMDGRDAVARACKLSPDVILMDIRMPHLDGLRATRTILGASPPPPVKVLVLTTFDLDDYVFEALHAGASGFLIKDASAAQLADAVRVVAAGQALLAPTVTRRLISRLIARTTPRLPLPAGLTPRENGVLRLMARGLSNAEIAHHLHIPKKPSKHTSAGSSGS